MAVLLKHVHGTNVQLRLCNVCTTAFILLLYSLVNEVNELSNSVDRLLQRLNESEKALKDLQDTRLVLEKEISNKTNSLFIDRQKCTTHRTRYPSTTKLLGYN